MSAQPCRESIAWAAGIIEGEGCFVIRKGRDRGIWVQVKMTDYDVIASLHNTFKLGNINGPYNKNRRKPVWVWRVSTFEGTQAVIAMIWPWLHSRRKARIKEIITEHHSRSKV